MDIFLQAVQYFGELLQWAKLEMMINNVYMPQYIMLKCSNNLFILQLLLVMWIYQAWLLQQNT